jgi:HSP20 family protein
MVRRLYTTYSPWREMRRMQREMDRLMNRMGTGLTVAPGYPAMNVWINEDGAIVTAELPGFDPDALDISVVNDTLTLSGNRCADEPGEGATYHRRERRCGKFTRSFQLPFLVEGAEVEASFEQGVLKIELPRAEADKPKKITVKTG